MPMTHSPEPTTSPLQKMLQAQQKAARAPLSSEDLKAVLSFEKMKMIEYGRKDEAKQAAEMLASLERGEDPRKLPDYEGTITFWV